MPVRNEIRIAKVEALEVRRLMSVASPPVVTITDLPTTAVNEGTLVTLSSNVMDVTPGPYTYFWDVTKNGSAFASGSNNTFSFTPNDNGSYVVSLGVRDSAGGTGSAAAQTITVNNVAPTPAINVPAGTKYEGDSILLRASATDPAGANDVVTFKWTVSKNGALFSVGSGGMTSFMPDDNGTYVVTLTARDEDGGSRATNVTIQVENKAPEAHIVDAPADGAAGTPIALTSEAFDAAEENDPLTYAWSVTKDGAAYAAGDGAEFAFVPARGGTYVVTLAVSDDDGGTTTDSATIVVTGHTPPELTVNVPAGPYAEGTAMTLNVSATGSDPIDPAGYTWVVMRGNLVYATGSGANFTFTPDEDGAYDATVTLDDGGTFVTASASFDVMNTAPQMLAIGAPAAGSMFEGSAVTLQGSAMDMGGVNDPLVYTWLVTRGGATFASGTGNDFTFTPGDDGSYVVTMSVNDDDGGMSSMNTTLAVANVAPQMLSIVTSGNTFVEGGAVQMVGAATDPAGTNDVLGFSWVVSRVGDSGNYASGSGANFSFTPGDDGTYVVTMMVDDGDGGVSSMSTTLTVANVAPQQLGIATSGSTFVEGTALKVTGSATDPAGANDVLAYSWVVKRAGDSGNFASGAGKCFTFTPDDNGTYVVTMSVSDGDGGMSTMSRSLVVNNVAPTATLSMPTPSNPVRGQSAAFVAAFADPGAHEAMQVMWDFGDGSVVSWHSVNDAGAMTPSHVFAATGSYTVTVRFVDKDGGMAMATVNVSVAAAAMQADPLDPTKTALVIGGTTANDKIDISIVRKGKTDMTSVTINGVEVGTFSPTGRVIVFGQAGDDQINASKGPALVTEMYGGAGNDTLTGVTGGASNLLVGGDGNDMLRGDSGRDLLIGGSGADSLIGGSGDDILVAGSTVHDGSNLAALRSVLAQWMRTDLTYDQRVAAIQSNPMGLNSGTVAGDNDVDSLSGGSGQDWFFGNVSGGKGSADTMHDRQSSEQVVDLPQAMSLAGAFRMLAVHGHRHIPLHSHTPKKRSA